ncbi:NF038132 family protein [Bowmanella dokdonensis]|uniref:NF038132 family protein n=1 Tax=Bowmanella dokdonensis TaxID=751969 RepID=A0A939IQ65_9ALTE|nr:NF038132 family protein [Bowmanella dokdonensis]MBN7826605.1 NF038132 family protein [Bowmanella dokdonensis]
MKFAKTLSVCGILLATLSLAAPASASLLSGWTGQGNYGSGGADGVVSTSPFGSDQYGYVSTDNGIDGLGLENVGGDGNATSGSAVLSPLFFAQAGDSLEFFFNYVTSDGAGFSDYGWARLLDSNMNQVALLFTARTTPGGDTVPGFDMPVPEATLVPGSTPINAGAPDWFALGTSSGSCYDEGCGYTGWIQASYEIAAAGSYFLQIGVVNWNDDSFQSGMAFDGATIGGNVIAEPVSAPASIALLCLGLLSLVCSRRRR